MSMKKIFIEGNRYVSKIKDAFLELETDENVKSILVLCGDGLKINKAEIDPVLRGLKKTVLGGIFPEIIYQTNRYSEGILLVGFKTEIHTIIIEDFEKSFNDTIKELKNWNNINPQNKSIFMFIDALVPFKNKVIDELYNAYGTFPNYLGAGTGSLEFKPFPNIFSNKGLLESACILGISDSKASIGVSHGWESISEPLKVTASDGNVLQSINWKPALEVYQEVIESHSSQKVDFEDFLATTKSYPFGINKLDSEMVVRDPFMHKDKCIYTLDNIPEGSFVHILYGNIDSLLQGAKKARQQAETARGEYADQSETFVIDCISRVLFMKETFAKEIATLNPDKNGFGVLSLGEIANNGDSYLEIFNKTAVVALLDA